MHKLVHIPSTSRAGKPSIGLKHMLRLTARQRPVLLSHDALLTDPAAYGTATRTEMRLVLSTLISHVDMLAAPTPWLSTFSVMHSTLSSLAVLRPTVFHQPVAGSERGTCVLAVETFAPRHVASASSLARGCAGLHMREMPAESYSRCGGDEDMASMALTAMHRLFRGCKVGFAEIGMPLSVMHRALQHTAQLHTMH